jgi:DNA-binding NarL/FixJ family response regulator
MRVVVLTSSEDIRDVTRAYQLGANSFLVKPLDFHNTVAMVETITDYWLTINMTTGPAATLPRLEDIQSTECQESRNYFLGTVVYHSPPRASLSS